MAQIKTVLSSPKSNAAVCGQVQNAGSQVDEATTFMAMVKLGDVWEQLFPAERHRIVNLMIERIDLVSSGLKVKWRALGCKALFGEFTPQSIGAELVETATSA